MRSTAMVAMLWLALAACASSEARSTETAMLSAAGPFISNDRKVRIDAVRSSAAGRRPAVIALHGASGVGNGWLIFPYAEAIAERGIDVFVVHYFDGLNANSRSFSSVNHFAARDRVIQDAIDHVGSLPDIDRTRIGLFGLSLGGFHAIGLAARDERIAAVVGLMGAMPHSVQGNAVRQMPPTLILHGARDDVVPIERAADLALLLGQVGAPFEMKVYVDAKHTLNGSAHGNSTMLSADFFDRHLREARSSTR